MSLAWLSNAPRRYQIALGRFQWCQNKAIRQPNTRLLNYNSALNARSKNYDTRQMPNGLHKEGYIINLHRHIKYILICFICSVMKNQRYNQIKKLKRYIKFLLIISYTEVVRIVRRKTLDVVIRSIYKSKSERPRKWCAHPVNKIILFLTILIDNIIVIAFIALYIYNLLWFDL